MPSSQRRSLAERRRRWNLLVDNRRHIVADLPHLDGDLGDLNSVSQEVEAMVALQARYLANLREVTAKIRVMGRKGDRLRGRIGASLRGQHGFDALKLIQFGFKPRRTKTSLNEEANELSAIPDAGTRNQESSGSSKPTPPPPESPGSADPS